jgi:hypothetical protein
VPAAFFTGRQSFGAAPAARTKILFEHETGPGGAEFTVHLSAPAAGDQVVCTDRAVAGRAVEKTVLADVICAQAAAQLDMITAEGLFTNPAADDMIAAEESAADRTSYVQRSSAGFTTRDLPSRIFGGVSRYLVPDLRRDLPRWI